MNDVMHLRCAEDLGDFEESQLVQFLARKKTIDFR